MYYNHAFVFTYIISVYLIVINTAINFSSGHRKRELNFNNYPASTSIVNPNEYNYYQRNEINDPGYTAQHDNNDDKTNLNEKNTNSTNTQNFSEFINPTGQMFHLIYMLPSPHKRQQASPYQGDGVTYQQLNGNNENLAYAGPHLFPTQLPQTNENIQQLNVPNKNFNALQNTYYNQQLLRSYHQTPIKDSKVTTKMEAPFIPSQFLGYDGQHQNQLLAPQYQQLQHENQQFSQQYQKMPQQQQQNQQQKNEEQLNQQNQQKLHQNQQQQYPLKPAPVYEQQESSPYPSSRLFYMTPNNIYNLYNKLN